LDIGWLTSIFVQEFFDDKDADAALKMSGSEFLGGR
jgi:hypothetical protein